MPNRQPGQDARNAPNSSCTPRDPARRPASSGIGNGRSRAGLKIVAFLLALPLFAAVSFAAAAGPVSVETIQITPEAPLPGSYPDIVATVRMRSESRQKETLKLTVVAVITRPDHVTRSWQWKQVVIRPGEARSFALPREYDAGLAGPYKVEFAVYSGDMQRRFHALSRVFSATEQPQYPARSMPLPGAAALATAPSPRERTYLGVGVYANAANPAGGATLLLWPFRHIGLQASYTVGTFTSYEGRMLVKVELASGWNPYLGAGYLHVSKSANVIGVAATFTDSTLSGVAGIEIPLGGRLRWYVEVSGAKVGLKKTVTDGTQTVDATVKYSPATVGTALVYSLF
jgi:hypothetical protein